jgi:hypothetical protein
MKSSVNSTSDTPAAAESAGRELLTGVLQRNPIVAVATALLSPIIGLFQSRRPAPARRPADTEGSPTEIEKLKVEHYRCGPSAPPVSRCPTGSRQDAYGMPTGSSQRAASRPRAGLRHGASRRILASQEGGIHHG